MVTKQQRKEYQKQWRESNKEKCKTIQRKYYLANRERFLLKAKHYNEAHHDQVKAKQKIYRENNREKLTQRTAEWRKANPDKCKEYHRAFKKRNANNPLFKLHNNIRLSIRNSLNNRGSRKSKQTHKYLGCSFDWFVNEYWPSKIKRWNVQYPNHPLTIDDCVIDHIKPIEKHNEHEIEVAWHYTNLQPLPAKINNLKSNHWTWDDERHFQCNILYKENYRDPYIPINVIIP